MNCISCGTTIEESERGNGLCDNCRATPEPRPIPDEGVNPKPDPEEAFDRMIERGSRPSLAEMYKRGRDQGYITPAHEYP